MMDPTARQTPPLFVDLDGTLVATDTLWLCVRKLLRRRPLALLVLPLVVLKGRAAFKAHIARRVEIDPERLPYRESVLRFLREEKTGGRELVLATAAHRRIAAAVASHVGLFDFVLASEGRRNRKGRSKLASILEHAPGGVFDYVGDSMADLPIFEAARLSHLVSPSKRLRRRVGASCTLGKVFE